MNTERLKKFAVVVPFLALFFLFRDVLFGNYILYDGDTGRVLYQYLNYISKDGKFISDYILLGFPISTSIVAGWFYPVYKLMFVLFDSFDTYRFLIIINIFLAYVFTYLYSRKIGFDSIIAATVSTVFIFSGQMIAWFTTLTNTNYYFILPAVLYFAEFVRQKKYKYAFLILTGLFLGTSWLSGHSQFVIYIHTFLAVYYFYWAFFEKKLKNWLDQLVNLLIVYSISLLVGWPQISAILSFREVTARAEGISSADFWLRSYLPQDVIHYILPFFKNPIIPFGAPNLYIGILPFVLLFFAFFVFKKIANKHFYLYLATFTLCLLASIKYSPMGLLLHNLPFLNSLRVASRIMFVGNFAAAVSVGFVLKYITENREEVAVKLDRHLNLFKKVFIYILIPVITFGSIVKIFFTEKLLIFINEYFLENLYAKTAGLPKEHYLNLINEYLSDSLNSIYIFHWDVFVFVVFSVLAFYLLKKINKFSNETFLTMVIVIISLNFTFAYMYHFNSVKREEIVSTPETAKFILSNLKYENEFRIFTPFTGVTVYNNLKVKCSNNDVSEEVLLQKELLTPSMNMYFGLDSIDGYDPFMPMTVAKIIGYLGSEHTTSDYSLAWENISLEDRVKKLVSRKNVLKSMNVKYVISAYEINDVDFKKVFSEEVGMCATKVNIYELADYWPRNFITKDLSILNGSNSFQEIMNNIESGNGDIKIMKDGIVSQDYGYDSINFEVKLSNDGLLFVGNSWLPGWHAYVDGVEVGLLRANYTFMSLLLSKGEHKVVLQYR